MDLAIDKAFPANYSERVLSILSALSMGGKIVMAGSASIRSQLYAGDFDAAEKVKSDSIHAIAAELQDVVKRVRALEEVYFGDIKCGEVSDWNIFPEEAYVEDGKVVNFNPLEAMARVDALADAKVLTKGEAKVASDLLEHARTPLGFLAAKKSLRQHILRWTPAQILAGSLTYRGRTFSLEEAVASGGMIKIDVIADIAGRYSEVSMIYDCFVDGQRITLKPPPLVRSLREDILFFQKENPFKALKRFFSLARHQRQPRVLARLTPILNSDLGRLYQIVGDLNTLADLLSRPQRPLAEIRTQLDEMRARLGNLYQMRDVLKGERELVGRLSALLKSPVPTLRRKLDDLITAAEGILSRATVKTVGHMMKKLI